MVNKIVTRTFEEFQNAVKSLKTNGLVLCFFAGAEDSKGNSWCPDCVAAKPVLDDALKKAPEDTTLVMCYIERAIWKDMQNPFRTDEKLKLTCVPTLLKWGTSYKSSAQLARMLVKLKAVILANYTVPQRLDDAQCQKKDLVEMLLED